MYYNEITEKPTPYKYRFKTEEEFEEEFGEEWESDIPYGWSHDLNSLIGQDFSFSLDNQYTEMKLKNGEIRFDDDGGFFYDGFHYGVCYEMLVENKKGINYNKPTKLVYEKKILSFKKFNSK